MHKIHQICLDYRENKNFSGTVLVRQGDNLLYQGAFGLAHRGFQIPNRIDFRFDTASVTKLFTVAAVLRLVQLKKISLSDRIHDLIDLTGSAIPLDVTVFHLLTHTSGIADDADEVAGESYSDLFIDKPNYSIRTTRDFLPQFVNKEPLFQAGTALRYNNCAFILLGLAIEALTGQDYRSHVQEVLFEPLGMEHTLFCAMDSVTANVAEGYTAIFDGAGSQTGWKKNIYSYPPIGSPDGGALSTVSDLDQFIRGLRSGLVLDPVHAELLFAPQVGFEEDFRGIQSAVLRQGFVFEFIEIGGEIRCIRKDGVNEGVGAILAFYPKDDLTIVILSNQDCNIWAMHRELEDALHCFRE